MRATVWRPINRFPGEFFLLGLGISGIVFVLRGPLEACLVTGAASLAQVLLLRRARRQIDSVHERLKVAEAELQTWEKRAFTFMEELSRPDHDLTHADFETAAGDVRQLEIDFGRFRDRFRRRGERFSLALIEVRPPAGRVEMPANALFEAARHVTACARPDDSLCRLTERQFGILLANAPLEGAEAFVLRVRIELGRLASGPVQFFTGEAEYQREMDSVWDLVSAAQTVLEAESRMGRRAAPLLHEVA